MLAFDLGGSARAFTRCMRCNGELKPVAKDVVAAGLPPRVRAHFDEFAQCAGCARVYWRGSHYERLQAMVDELRPVTTRCDAPAKDPTPP
jgi:hypothetical protein